MRQVHQHPSKVGVRKIYQEYYETFRRLQIGRDALFGLLRREGLLVRCRRRRARTTNSRHGFDTWQNLIVGYEATGPNEVLASDITYVDTMEGWRYLALVTDAYSCKIVGWDLSCSLSVEGSLRALEMALRRSGRG